MTDWKNTKLDDASMWPREHVVALEPPHADERGAIQSLVNFPMKNLSLITSKKGTVRSNHYHVTDWHYMYVLVGSFDYYYRPTGSGTPVVTWVKAGEMVFNTTDGGSCHRVPGGPDPVASRNPRIRKP